MSPLKLRVQAADREYMLDVIHMDSFKTAIFGAAHVGRTSAAYASGETGGTASATSGGGDRVSLSMEARKLYAAEEAAKKKTEENQDPAEMAKERVEERIKQLQAEIEEVRESDLPKEEKDKRIQQLQSEIAMLNQQLMENKRSPRNPGGTRAEGFSASLT